MLNSFSILSELVSVPTCKSPSHISCRLELAAESAAGCGRLVDLGSADLGSSLYSCQPLPEAPHHTAEAPDLPMRPRISGPLGEICRPHRNLNLINEVKIPGAGNAARAFALWSVHSWGVGAVPGWSVHSAGVSRLSLKPQETFHSLLAADD